VKTVGRILLFIVVAVVALGAIVLIGVNLYVQSQGTHARIQQELSQRIGAPMRLQRISVTPWGGLKLSGITIPQVDPVASKEFLAAKTFRLRVRFWSLFSQRLVIKEVSLVNPNVVWAQNADGQWRLPMTPEATPPPPGPAPNIAAVALPPPRAIQHQTPAPAPAQQDELTIPTNIPDDDAAVADTDEEPPGATAFTPEIRRVNLTGGNFEFLDKRGNAVATFLGLDFHSGFRTASALRGTAKIAKTSLRNRFFLESLQSNLRYDPTALELSQITATAAGGQLSGSFRMSPQSPGSPFAATIKFKDVQAEQLVSGAGGPAGVVHGKLEGHLEATGKTADADALKGTGEIFLREGELKQYTLLIALGQLLQIEELTRLHLDDAHVKYHIEPGVVVVDELLLRSPNVHVAAKGTIAFSGKIRLESQLALNDKIRGQLFDAIRDKFQPNNEPGFAAVDFKIGGTVDKPKTDLMDKLVGRDFKDLGTVISSIFGGNKPEKKKAKANNDTAATSAAEESPAPVPEDSPSPAASTDTASAVPPQPTATASPSP
jgi:hypothetical protein